MGVAGFVDLHCHALPGLDDGPKTDGDAVALLEQAYLSGTAAIVATPHFNFRYAYEPARAAALVERLEREAPSAPLLFPGCELELNDEALRAFFADPPAYTLNGSRYALVEPPLRFPPDRIPHLLLRFREAGITAILAHPERSPLLQAQPDLAVGWARAGGLMQITASSFLGRMGRRAEALAWDLLEAGLAHFVASDAHDTEKRPPDLRPAFWAVHDRAGREIAARLFTHNPSKVLHDERLS
jgi:protein-tyrosine phosphatase